MLTLLAVALIAQSDLDRVRGLEFTRLQVNWIAESIPFRGYDRVLPRDLAGILWALDCTCPHSYTCRELAHAELARRGESAVDALFWGVAKGSPEVKSRCARLLRPYYQCRDCDGDGVCRTCRGGTDITLPCPAGCGYNRHCVTCLGEIDLRSRLMPRHNDAEFMGLPPG